MTHIVGSLITRNELGRYLEPCIRALQACCDEIRVLDDGSTDGTRQWLQKQERLTVRLNDAASVFEHEGQARARLLEHTLAEKPFPTHILAVDADELVTDGRAIRAACETDAGKGAWTLDMVEVWKTDPRWLWSREDGGWRAHGVPVLYRVTPGLRMPDRQLAGGRVPVAINRRAPFVASGSALLHMGWANAAERAARHQRYVEADGGRFHAGRHLDSIMWPDRKVRLARREWPSALAAWRERLIERANQDAVAA